jgi:hypothetical protein
MADLPGRESLAEALGAVGRIHSDYERVLLKGVRDEFWSGFYAAFVLGRLGEFADASRLAQLLEEVDAPEDWSAAAAAYVLRKLQS